jgi:NAD(P)H-dependent FMN reductase
MAIPEYNGTVSSPFKNTYDWLSRAYENSTIDKVAPLQEKLVGIMSSAGVLGGQTAQ